MLRFARFVFILMVFLFAAPQPVMAQESAETPEFQLNFRREFGYGSNADVRGSMSLSVRGPEEKIQAVTYLMDGQEMARLTEAPFKFKFSTGSYPAGWHDFTAIVETVDGRKVDTQLVRKNFLNAEQESESMKRIFIPLGGILLLVVVLGVGSQMLVMRDPKRAAPGAHRNYGLKGGTICPRCGRPYPIHFFSFNLIGGYYDRCDYCGKWAFVRRFDSAQLSAAEEAELRAVQNEETSLPGAAEPTDEERLRKMIDDSRYTG